MSPPRKKHCAAAVLSLFAIISFTGCTSMPGASTPVPTSTTAVEEADTAEFTDADLAQVCIDATSSAFGPGVEFDADNARVEARTVEPEWLVLVPAQAPTYLGEAQCTIGGSPESPVIEMSSASSEPFPEEQIQNLIDGENEGGTK